MPAQKPATKRRPKLISGNKGASITRAEVRAMGDRILAVDFEMGAVMFWHLLRIGGTYDGHKFEGIEHMAAEASNRKGGLGVNPLWKHPKKLKGKNAK